MKKIIIVALLAIFTATTAFEKPLTKTTNYRANNELFDGAEDVAWTSTEHFTEVSFTLKGEKQKIFYSPDGEYLGITKNFAFDKLPEKALNTILKKYSYPKYELKECIEYKNAHGDVNYYISFLKKNRTVIVEVSPNGYVGTF